MISINAKNLNKSFMKISIFILVLTLIYLVSFELGRLSKYIHMFNFNSIHQERYLYFAYPFAGMLFTIALFFLCVILYVIVMLILSSIINLLWKKNIVEFTYTKNMSIFERVLRHIWFFID